MQGVIAYVIAILSTIATGWQDKEPFTHYDQIVIQSGGSTDTLINVRKVPFGEAVRLKIALNNPSDSSVSIDKVKMSCNCLSLNSFDKVLPSKGTGNLELLLKGEERNVRSTSSSTATLHLKNDSVQSIRFRVTYIDMICFTQDRVELSFSDKTAGFVRRIPVTISDDIKLESYSLEMSSPLKDFSARLLNNDFGVHVEVACESFEQVKERKSGTISILKNNEVVDICSIGVQAHQPVRLTPSTIVFERDGAKTDFIGHALLRIDSDQADEFEAFSIKSADGSEFKTTATKIGKGTYRIKVHTSKVLDSQLLDWSLKPTLSEPVVGKVKILFP
jgi:hypothetical protein